MKTENTHMRIRLLSPDAEAQAFAPFGSEEEGVWSPILHQNVKLNVEHSAFPLTLPLMRAPLWRCYTNPTGSWRCRFVIHLLANTWTN